MYNKKRWKKDAQKAFFPVKKSVQKLVRALPNITDPWTVFQKTFVFVTQSALFTVRMLFYTLRLTVNR